jgi:hypothetical protein
MSEREELADHLGELVSLITNTAADLILAAGAVRIKCEEIRGEKPDPCKEPDPDSRDN